MTGSKIQNEDSCKKNRDLSHIIERFE
jgi:hypothetical protein